MFAKKYEVSYGVDKESNITPDGRPQLSEVLSPEAIEKLRGMVSHKSAH